MFLITVIRTKKRIRQRTKTVRHVTNKPDVAELDSEEIAGMDCADLIEAIRAAHLPFLQSEFEHRLEFCDREMLERLVYLARRCCRNQGY